MRKSAILITGCAGFIGSNLVKYFLNQKKIIIGVDNLKLGKFKNIKKLLNNNNIKNLENNNMFALGFIRGAILGVSLGLMASLIAKKICKKDNNASNSEVDKKVN